MLAGLTFNVQMALAGIIALLALSTLGVAGLVRTVPQADFSELVLRTRTWWLMVAMLMAAAVLGREVTVVFLALVSFLALREFLSLVPVRRADRAVLLWAYAAIPLQYTWIAQARFDLFLITVPLGVLFALSANMVIVGETKGFLAAIGSVTIGLLLTVFGLGHLAAIAVLPNDGNPAGGSTGLLVYLVFLAQFSDVIQYVGGKLLGHRRVIPRVSPNKTLAGVVCGFAATVILAVFLAPWLTPLTPIEAVAAGVLIALCGFAGDVTMSAIKRDVGAANSGSLLPGHGGILDRVDSLMFAAPMFFHLVTQLHYVR